ncbi:MAG TPA: 4-hydroxythreonine-4-phosphate dehydrogenase PdxA [Xanthobacteraceae bacterium]|nr:4-hydroxythreonine-4-phosphate dehydrogenase PdxA [Xanthobacteraceae bacterium]
MGGKPKIAIATGDPAGIGPEISLKAALDPKVRAVCDPIVVSDLRVLDRHAKACGIKVELRGVKRIGEAQWSGAQINVLDCALPYAAAIDLGTNSADAGRAIIAFAGAAVKAARAGEVDAVAAAPQNETSIALAGIPFDGHPSFVARETGTDVDDVYLMLCFGERRIVHATLHTSVREAIGMITRERVIKVIHTADRALRQLGIARPRIGVSGLNPHAGEDGLFGREEIEIIRPAIDTAAAEGIAVSGPIGADILFHKQGYDAFVVMLHDQGHIAAKLVAPNATAAMTIGTPILFASVAHGSAHDIAGKGIANPAAMIEAIMQLAKARRG